MDLPTSLRAALERAAEEVTASALASATRALSDRYRERDIGPGYLRSRLDVLAYSSFRLPATYAAVRAVLSEVGRVLPSWQPASLLDVGAGPGTATWAAMETWSSLTNVELVERNPYMSELGRTLGLDTGPRIRAEICWNERDVTETPAGRPRDLVIMSYAYGELDPAHQRQVLERLWHETDGLLVLVEPGTPGGFEAVRAARSLLIESGGHIVAPCPHALACPMSGGDWCHFSRRLARSRTHRQAKDGTLAYEDEKYSYVAVSRMPVEPVRARILRHPYVRAGHISLELCTREGLESRIVTRRDRAGFRAARQAVWGGSYDDASPVSDDDARATHRPLPGP